MKTILLTKIYLALDFENSPAYHQVTKIKNRQKATLTIKNLKTHSI